MKFRSEKDHDDLVRRLARGLAPDLASAKKKPSSASLIRSSPCKDLYGKLDRIVGLDVTTSSVKVEANVTMEALVHFTLGVYPGINFLPAVVANTRDMKVAEAFAAQSSESSSFAFGTFDCTVTRIEVILDNGEITHFGPHNRLDEARFYEIPGRITMLDISVVRAGPYVEVEIRPAPYADPIVVKQNIAKAQKEPSLDFLEVLMLTDSYSVITGRFASKPTGSGTFRVIERLSDLDTVCWDAKECQSLVMPSDLYLFRNDRRVTNLVEQMPNAVEYRDFGILYSVVNRLIVQIPLSQAPIILRLYPVLSPQVMGRRIRHGIAATPDFGMDLWGPSTFCSEHIQDIDGRHGFHLLSGKTPCKRGKSWDLFHDKGALKRRCRERL